MGVGKLFSFSQLQICTLEKLPSFMTTVSWPGSLRIWTAIVAKWGWSQGCFFKYTARKER